MPFVNEPPKKSLAFIDFYENHQEYCELAIMLTGDLKALECALKTLAIDWQEVRISYIKKWYQPTKGRSEKILAFVQDDGSSFSEDDELEKIDCMKARIKTISGCFSNVHTWLADVEEQTLSSFPSTNNYPNSNLLSLKQQLILNNEEIILHNLMSISKMLDKAHSLLESIHFSAEMIRADFFGAKVIPKLFLLCASIVGGGKRFAQSASEIAQINEHNWQDYKGQVIRAALESRNQRIIKNPGAQEGSFQEFCFRRFKRV